MKNKQVIHAYTDSELAGLQRVSLDMASVFWEFCKEHELTAYMCGGGCIGAMRLGRFIPWDDNLDFFMPRRDYERFIRLWPSYEPGRDIALSVSDKDHTDHNLFATLRDKKTTQILPHQEDLDLVHGVAVDIRPLDGYPDDPKQRKKQLFWAGVYELFITGEVPAEHKGIKRFFDKVFITLFRGQGMRYRFWSMAQKRMTKYRMRKCTGITELCSGPEYRNNRYESVWFHTYREVPFEDRMLPVPIGAEEYLKTAFGNYMILPPEEERVAHHQCIFLDLENPCAQYRGVYYLRRSEPKHQKRDWKVKTNRGLQ